MASALDEHQQRDGPYHHCRFAAQAATPRGLGRRSPRFWFVAHAATKSALLLRTASVSKQRRGCLPAHRSKAPHIRESSNELMIDRWLASRAARMRLTGPACLGKPPGRNDCPVSLVLANTGAPARPTRPIESPASVWGRACTSAAPSSGATAPWHHEQPASRARPGDRITHVPVTPAQPLTGAEPRSWCADLVAAFAGSGSAPAISSRGPVSSDAGTGGSALRGDAALGSGFRMGQRQLALAVRAALMLVSATRLHSVGIARDIFLAALFVRVQRRIRKGLLAGFGLAICIRLELCPRVVGTCPTEYSLAGQATQPEVGAPTLSQSDGPGAA
jgi:hypothetical protein